MSLFLRWLFSLTKLFAIISRYLCAYLDANPSFKCRSLGVLLSLDKHTSAIGREEEAEESWSSFFLEGCTTCIGTSDACFGLVHRFYLWIVQCTTRVSRSITHIGFNSSNFNSLLKHCETIIVNLCGGKMIGKINTYLLFSLLLLILSSLAYALSLAWQVYF